ncbi:MAG: tetratricopeptide repeat protein, partial [Myxococcota bacterium]
MGQRLSTADAARILGLSEARIREFVRSGLCRPARDGRRYAFSFQELVVLRTAAGLLAQNVPLARVRRALAALVAEIPPGRALSGLRVFADGKRVAVRDGGTAWEPETGQTLLDFEVDELAERVTKLRDASQRAEPGGDSHARALVEFERGIDLEDDDPAAACDAYGKALALDPDLVDAWVNLGRIAHQAGNAAEAVRLYHHALERTPEDPVIHFNLALALEDARGAAPAASHYEKALELDPSFADAHFNLAALCEKLGRKA